MQHQQAIFSWRNLINLKTVNSDDIFPAHCWKIKLWGLWGGNYSPYQKTNSCSGRQGTFKALPCSPSSQSLEWRALTGDSHAYFRDREIGSPPYGNEIEKTKTASGIESGVENTQSPILKHGFKTGISKGVGATVFCIMLRNPWSKTFGCELTICFISGLFLFISFCCLFPKPRKQISLHICFGLNYFLLNHCSFCCCLLTLVIYKSLFDMTNIMTKVSFYI